MPYIAVTAMAYLGGVAAAARNERTFRDTSFINNVLRQRMEPKTIARASLLRRNPECRADVKAVAKQLVKDAENAKRQKS